MDASIIAALVAAAGGIVVAWLRYRRPRRSGEPPSAAMQWREQYDLATARAILLDEQLTDEREARSVAMSANAELRRENGALRAKLHTTQDSLDDCERQRHDLYQELAGVSHRTRPRQLRAPAQDSDA